MGSQYTQNETCFSPAGLCHVNVIVRPKNLEGKEGHVLAPALADDGSSGAPTAPGLSSAPTRQATTPVPTGHGEEARGRAWLSRSEEEVLRDSNRSLLLGTRSMGHSGQCPSAAAVFWRTHCTARGGQEHWKAPGATSLGVPRKLLDSASSMTYTFLVPVPHRPPDGGHCHQG